MKAAVILYHKNVHTYYPKKWVDDCILSIKRQTYKDFTVFECDYGEQGNRLMFGNFYNLNLPTHADAHNFLLDKVFEQDYDCAFNINIDDFYHLQRFEKQIAFMKDYDVVSSNFIHMDEDGNMIRTLRFDNRDIKREIRRKHNVIAHPAVCYSRNFWLNCSRLRPKEIPRDDLRLWQRSVNRFKFKILPEILLYYRIHENNVSK